MDSTFSGIEMGKRALFAHSRALSTVGHNVSNASTEGYSRQRVEMSASTPIYMPQLNRAETPGQIGQGVDITRIERVRDQLLDGRIVANSSDLGYWQTRDNYILQLDQLYNEPTDLSVRNLMDRFWGSWQELANNPEQLAARNQVLESGKDLVTGIQTRYKGLEQIRSMLNDDIGLTVEHVNDLSSQIANLNKQIVQSKAEGDQPNDLMDRRDKLIEELGGIIDITVDHRDTDEVNVHTGGMQLIQGGAFHKFELKTDQNNEGFPKITWDYNGQDAVFQSGKLAALVELRDVDVREEIQNLDNMSLNFTDLVNQVHSEGYGMNGRTGLNFFDQHPFVNNVNGNYDSTGDGQFDSSYIFRIRGSNSLDAQQEVGLAGVMTFNGPKGPVQVQYRPEDTVGDIISRINNSGSEVVASLDRNGRMTLKATTSAAFDRPDFVIQHVEDSGQFLTGYSGILLQSGPAGAYDYGQADAVASLRGGELDFQVAPLGHPSGWMQVSEEVSSDPASIATSFGSQGKPGEAGDGRAALEIASLREKPVMVGSIETFTDYFANAAGEIGLKGQESELKMKTHESMLKDLKDTRASISGVNIDEELANMIKYQHGYQAASRFITTFNDMLDTIINRMGV